MIENNCIDWKNLCSKQSNAGAQQQIRLQLKQREKKAKIK